MGLLPRKLGRWTVRHDSNIASETFVNQYIAGRPSGRDTTSDPAYVLLLRRWLDDCKNNINHVECADNRTPVWRPTRLIFVGTSESPQLRLQESISLRQKLFGGSEYIALSHCWGNPTRTEIEQFCLTNANSQRLLQGFDMIDLPRTFQDAVDVARALKVQFLWIDALCINQTDPDSEDSDWNKEARSMQDVFNWALVTISATSATNWDQGFLPSRLANQVSVTSELSEVWRVSVSRTRTILSLGRAEEPCEHWDELENRVNDFRDNVDDRSPLAKRAWVLQERVLSRRLIHFAGERTYWECGRTVRCDDFRELRCEDGRDYFLHDPNFPKRLADADYRPTVDFLQFLFQKYAQCGLTKTSDREIAIHGLIERMQTVLGTECRHGIFAKYLHRLLLWQRRRVANTSTVSQEVVYADNLPSWSWMSYSHVDFVKIPDLMTAPRAEVWFEPGQPQSLLVRVRKVRKCRVYHLDDSIHGTNLKPKHCVVIGVEERRNGRDVADHEDKYHVLLVKKLREKKNCGRIGVGWTEALFVHEKWSVKSLI